MRQALGGVLLLVGAAACSGGSATPKTLSPSTPAPSVAYGGSSTACATFTSLGAPVTDAELTGGCTQGGNPHYFLVNTCPNGTQWTFDSDLKVAGAVGKTWVTADDAATFEGRACS